jgi:hypothetical protein
MLEIPGFKSLRKIPWKDLDPGMIVVGGVKVNNGTPNPKPQTPNPKPQTPNPKPRINSDL